MVFLPQDYVVNPLLMESAYEIDQLMQKISVDEHDYALTVYELEYDQAQIYVMNKLKGH